MQDFAARLIDWQRTHGRHDLPWQGTRDPYRIWVAEIMLQQTQVLTVIPYYTRFLARFPDLAELARAPLEAVLALWSGLGYYARARNLHRAARLVVERHEGRFPRRFEDIVRLPGVGRSTAAAIAVFAYGERRAILDGNVRRVLARVFGVEGWPGQAAVAARLWALAEALLPEHDLPAYTQGLMDLGASVCTRRRPRCAHCPLTACSARLSGRQHELPAPRPRRDAPRREADLLVLLHAGAVLLERRPPSGVWGGLWSLPQCPQGVDAGEAARRLGCEPAAVEPLARLEHAFTHFTLSIRPWLVHVRAPIAASESAGRLWLPLAELDGAALPAPVRRLLQAVDARTGQAGQE
ncbi:MAG: A/G-specific adenine glycosylase [Thiobacillaceae bacterium]|nr:A/G-specific adenine glycosylase [Thiobacillaceae bacterium]MCX7673555.1 A/G-specific adenine glycosylase [Thiobacillaceae bacterium]MDW8323404.1 A/G-specific adenine glycosylase [Burkholderiales bacterium]